MASQGSFNMNTSLIPMLRPGRELPRIFSKQTSSLKWQNVWNPSPRFPLCHMRRADFFLLLPSVLTLPKPHLLSGHLKFIKCDSMITFTHSAFDLLSLNYHKAAQRRTSQSPPPLCHCNCILNFGRWGILIRRLRPDIAGVTLPWWDAGGALLRNNGGRLGRP